MHNALSQRIYYTVLFALVGSSSLVFCIHLFGGIPQAWAFYQRAYTLILLLYTWYTLLLLLYADLRKRKYTEYAGEKFAVVIPCYNESPGLLKQAIASIVAAKGNKKIILIDDGSTNDIRSFIRKLADQYGLQIYLLPKNQGKRHALHYAITHAVRDCDYVVTLDSDTVIDHNALVRVVEPLKIKSIGAATGDVRLLNEQENWLTRMIGAYYWIGLNVYKKGQSVLGIVSCCSGCLAAYKTSLIKEMIDEFLYQEFFGERCTHSEDRHLTNLVLKRGYDVVYVPEAISYTETPSTISGFLRQQQRWKRGFIRESLYTLSYAWRQKKPLFLQILFWELTIPFFAFGLALALVGTIVTNPSFFLTAILPSWILFMLIRYATLALYAREKLPGLFVYMVFYELFLYWMHIYALFTVKNKGWLTR